MALKSTKGRYIAEAIGTFILVFVSIGAVIINVVLEGHLGVMGISLAAGLAVLVVCYSLGHVSGAHINPAVTIAFASQKRFPLSWVLPYIISQIMGALAACIFLYILFGNIANFGFTYPLYPWPMVFLIEFVITFILMLVIMGVATDPRAADPSAAGLPIGLTVMLNTMLALIFTGAMMNPARVIALGIVSGEFGVLWVYLASTVLGAIFGAWVYERIRGAEAPKFEEFGLLGPIE